jgi:two-component system cell cycle sensor histidine kinase/response regulator CckA
VAQDVTEKKRVESEKEKLEGQLRQSQKLEAVGQLAGGVAHDSNNLLAVILNYGKFVQEDLEPGTSTHEDVTQVLSAADKAARLVKQLLAFSRREIVKPEIIDLNDVVDELHRLLARTTKESIKIVVDLGEDLWRTNADPGQIEQVLLNLAVNADAAMPDGGTLSIRTSNQHLSEEAAAQRAELTPGNYVCVSVSDDGVGMSEATAAHMFEPFFTTKGIGEGTGLGLSTVYGIVKQAGGYIYAYSEEGRGTTFNIYLPATDAVALSKTVGPFPTTARDGSGTILVVEDEDGVRAITERILTEGGYDVLVASDPFTAFDLASETDRIDLLLTDVIMPGLSGRELAHRLQSLRPGLKTVFMSGYTDEIIARQGVLEDGVTFLQKPFGADDLLSLVRDVLDDDRHPRLERASTVLVVDDEEPMRQVLELVLGTHGFKVVGSAASASEAIEMARDHHPDLIILDQSMPGTTGAEAAPKLREASPQSKICAFSGILVDPPSWADAFLSKEKIGELPPMLEELSV